MNPPTFNHHTPDTTNVVSAHQTHGTDQNAGYIGQPIHFTTGQFTGQTVRAQLEEVQKADLGRKRPLDPPPVVLLRLFHVYNAGTDRQSEKEIPNYDTVQTLGLVCTVDLFPVQTADAPGAGGTRKDFKEGTSRRHSSASNQTPYASSALTSHYPQNSFTFVSGIPYDSSQKSSVGLSPTHPVSHSRQPSSTTSYLKPSSSSSSASTSPTDVIYKAGNLSVTESSKMTHALVGATFVQPANVDYKGRKSLMFVFSDLAVKIEGSFILRYRVFDIFSKAYGVQDLVIQAECYGGTFRVYSTKEFPGLQASTELTKQLARWGVRLNIRETERKRRKKGERRSVSPDSANGRASTSTRPSATGDRRHTNDDSEGD